MADLETVQSDLEATQANFDAEQLKEDIAEGEEKAPDVNVEADYNLAKAFSAPAAPSEEAGTAVSGDPDNFRNMAKAVLADAEPAETEPVETKPGETEQK
jgi:hypothetical protein